MTFPHHWSSAICRNTFIPLTLHTLSTVVFGTSHTLTVNTTHNTHHFPSTACCSFCKQPLSPSYINFCINDIKANFGAFPPLTSLLFLSSLRPLLSLHREAAPKIQLESQGHCKLSQQSPGLKHIFGVSGGRKHCFISVEQNLKIEILYDH